VKTTVTAVSVQQLEVDTYGINKGVVNRGYRFRGVDMKVARRVQMQRKVLWAGDKRRIYLNALYTLKFFKDYLSKTKETQRTHKSHLILP